MSPILSHLQTLPRQFLPARKGWHFFGKSGGKLEKDDGAKKAQGFHQASVPVDAEKINACAVLNRAEGRPKRDTRRNLKSSCLSGFIDCPLLHRADSTDRSEHDVFLPADGIQDFPYAVFSMKEE
jgi:hypothetical protein